MSFNQIFILGAGAIGSACGALLSRKNKVTLIGNKTHINRVNSKGLEIVGDVNRTFRIKGETTINHIPDKTLIVLATKAHDSARATRKIRKLLKKDTVILVLQNGLGNEGIVQKIVGEEITVLRGITSMGSEMLEPGKISYWTGPTVIGSGKSSETVAEVLNDSGLKTSISNTIGAAVWTKLAVNCIVNPLTAVFLAKDFEIVAEPLKPVRHGALRECVEVAGAEGWNLHPSLEKIDEDLRSYGNYSSMCQDIMKGRKTEIDFINGKIVELGKKHGIPTPINETLLCFVKFLEGRH